MQQVFTVKDNSQSLFDFSYFSCPYPPIHIVIPAYNESNAILLNTKNCFLGFLKNITIETDKDIESGTFKIVARYKLDLQLNEEPANALVTGITI